MPQPRVAAMLRRLASIDRRFDGTFSVYIKDLASTSVGAYNVKRPFYLASTVKVPFAVAVFTAVAAGRLALDQKVKFTADDLRDGAGKVKRSKPGTEYTVEQLVDEMLSESDNTAADMLVGLVGIDQVNQTIEDLGLKFGRLTALIEVRRQIYSNLDPRGLALTPAQIYELWLLQSFSKRAQVLGNWWRKDPNAWKSKDLDEAYAAYYRSGMNSARMEEVGRLLEKIAKSELFSRELSESLLQKMKACRTAARRFDAVFPADIEIAQKTGTQYQRACDVGIAYFSADRPVVMAVCAENFKKTGAAEKAIRDIGQAVYEFFK